MMARIRCTALVALFLWALPSAAEAGAEWPKCSRRALWTFLTSGREREAVGTPMLGRVRSGPVRYKTPARECRGCGVHMLAPGEM